MNPFSMRSRPLLFAMAWACFALPLRAQVASPATTPASDTAARQTGVTLRVVVPADARTVVKALRIAGTYNNWAVPQAMTDRGDGVFEYAIVNPALVGQTVEYRLYPGGSGGWDGAEGPDSFKRTFVYAPDKIVVLQDVVFGANGVSAASAKSATGGAPTVTIAVNDQQTFQTMDGFGAALTDASAWLIAKKLSAAQRKDLLDALFDAKVGAGLSYLRLPIGASDFSIAPHTYDDLAPGATDNDLKHFSIAYDEAYIIPVLKEIRAVNLRVGVLASPWSAPAWMKTGGSLNGGRLRSDDATYAAYADYLVRFVQAYAADGIPIDAITLQNEPWNETRGYPSMRVEPADEIRLVKLLGPRFRAAHLATKIIIWDHNWDHPDYPISVLSDPDARPYIDGTAFHGYAGNVQAQLKVHDAFPDKNLYFTESTGGNFATNFSSNLMWDLTNLLVGSTRDGAKTVLKWNLALDETNGPHLPGGPNNCRGIVTIDTKTGAVTREEEYYAFAHAAKGVVPGAKRIDTDNDSSVAFVNPDGSTELLLFNAGYNTQPYRILWHSRFVDETLPPRSVLTLVWGKGENAAVQAWLTTGDQTKLLERQADTRFSAMPPKE